MGDKVVFIDCNNKEVIFVNGEIIFYDKFVLVMGFYLFVFFILGKDCFECLVYRIIEDLEVIEVVVVKSWVGVVVGGGLFGFEVVKVLKDLGLEIYVIEFVLCLMVV